MLATQFLYIATVELIPDSPISQRHLGVRPAGDIVNAPPMQCTSISTGSWAEASNRYYMTQGCATGPIARM